MVNGSRHNERTGDVFINDFDRGVIVTLGGVVNAIGTPTVQANSMYVVHIPKVEPPPDYEGIPIYFAFPDESVDLKILPSIIVRRDSIVPALSRWHLGNEAYNVPAVGAHPITVTNPRTGAVIAEGFDTYESKSQAVPFDLVYTIEIRARFRNNLKVESMLMLRYVMRHYQPYTRVSVVDSLGDTRYYDAFNETYTGVDIMPDITGREANFNVTLRVEGELDLNDPRNQRVVTNLPTIVTSIKS